MDPAFAPGTTSKSVVFQDGLGERRRISDVSGADTIEQLCLRGDLTAIPSFEFALRERASRLTNFRHVYYGHVRSIDRLNDPSATLTVVSDSIKGVRLASLLAASQRRPLTLDINASVHLMRQVVAAVAVLHENARDVSHGAIGPERIIVTPNARVVIVEYVLGAALEQLRFSQERYWKELRVALPSAQGSHFDQRADVAQIGVVALSLILGRLLRDEEYPSRVGDALASAWAISSKGELEPLPDGLRAWIGRALQLDASRSFASAVEARDELERVLSGDDEVEEDDSDDARDKNDGYDARAQPTPSAAEQVSPSENPAPASGWMAMTRPPARGGASSSAHAGDASFLNPAGDASFLKTEAPKERSIFSMRDEPIVKKDDPAAKKKDEPAKRDEPVRRSEPFSWQAPAAAQAPLYPALGPNFGHNEQTNEAGPAAGKRPMGRIAAAAVALIVISAGGVYAGRKFLGSGTSSVATGTLNINSNPAGAQVVVDGQTSGVTPLVLTLKQGPHNVELRGAGDPRTVPITITAGKELSEYVELPKGVTAFGQLQVRTEPAGAQVTVDGIPRGKSPVLVESLAAGEHSVVLEADNSNVKQTVSVEAGMTASLVVPMTTAEMGPVSGWISVTAPVELQVFEGKRLVGSSQSDRLMMTAGRHDIEIVNETLGYRQTRTIQVPAGKTAPVKIEWPKGTIAINALPWADVWIDGERIGETPIGNLQLPIGPHEILFRHPDLGEQKYATTVSLKGPVRVSVDLRKK